MKGAKKIWRKITLCLPSELEEEGGSLLIGLGAEGVWVEGAGAEVALHVFFPETKGPRAKIKEIRRALSKVIPNQNISIREASLPEERWRTAWRERSVPVQRIGKKWLVVPPWRFPIRNRSGREVVQISPGMAFGTGTHPTTRGCLLFLEEVLSGRPGGSLLDVGTGSGLLAIAAAKWGARRVVAAEIDPVALRAARKNARLNRVASKIGFRKTIPARSRYRSVVANLTAPALLALFPVLTRKVEKRGKLILSGILRKEGPAVLERYRESFSLLRLRRGGEWMTFLLEKKSP